MLFSVQGNSGSILLSVWWPRRQAAGPYRSGTADASHLHRATFVGWLPIPVLNKLPDQS